MEPARHARVKALFLAACDLEPSQRGDFLTSECGDDLTLRRDVEALLDQITTTPTAVGGLAADTPKALPPGALVADRYRIEAELGAGGMGRVYRATQLALRREVALKVLSAGATASEAARLRFEREAAAVARLHHPNIVMVYDAGTEPGIGAFFAMELVSGRSLADELADRGRLPVAEAVGLARQIAEAVDAAHGSGVVHRDLKPANVMLERSGGAASAKVLDFGIAKLVGTAVEIRAGEESGARLSLTASGTIFGTPLYMSPEQARGEAVDARTDVWSIGVILYEALSGANPFGRRTAPATFAAILRDDPAPLAGVPDALAKLVARSIAKGRDARVESARELAAELSRIADALAAGAVAAAPAATNVPAELDPLIGRDAELGELSDELGRDHVRLVTLTGPGGTGKTRLARAVARRLLASFEDGVFFVDLSAIRDPALVTATVARELDVKESGATPLEERLADRLRERRMLLVLDNFEQVLDAAPLVGRLLSAAPRLKTLVTSRAPLRVSGEREVAVPPLALPASGRNIQTDELGRCAAVALFVDRAGAARRGFALTDRNAATVAEICRRLDGLPLAIELAAARMRLLSPETLLARLGERLRLLTTGDRDLPERQRTMRGAVAWSYDLLDEDAKRVFERLSIFAGGCRIEQAEAVCGGEGVSADVLDALTSLVEASLLATTEDADGETRFRMLEVVREFSLDRLAARGQVDTAARAHAEIYGEFAYDAAGRLTGEHMAEWLVRLEQEHDNLRAALSWTLERDPETCLRLATAVGNLWALHEHYDEGRRWLDAALRRAPGASPAMRAKALRRAGTLARQQGDLVATRELYEESMRASNETGDPVQIAWSCIAMSHLLQDVGDISGARECLTRCLAISRASGHERQTANALNDLGELALLEGDSRVARPFYEEALEIFRRVGDPDGISTSAMNIGKVAALERDADTAETYLREAIALDVALGSRHGVLSQLDGFSAVAAARHGWTRAARLMGAAEALCESIGYTRDLPQRRFYESYADEVRAALDDEAFEAAATEGRALTLDEAVALALEDAR